MLSKLIASPPATYPSTHSVMSQPPNGPPKPQFTEYKLKMSPMAVLHNVMVLHSTQSTLSSFTPPIRMTRDKASMLGAEEPAPTNPTTAKQALPVGKSSLAAKKKTRLIFADDQPANTSETEAEAIPWLLEDFDAQHSFLGRLEGGQSSNYVFFVNQGDEFRIIPVNKWYRFQPKLSYHTLTIEEAEQEVKGDVNLLSLISFSLS